MVGCVGELEPFQQLRDPAAAGVAAEVASIGHQTQVFVPGEQVVHGGELAGDADQGAHRVRVAGHVVPTDPDVTGVGANQGRQDAHHRRLPGSVGPEQREDRAFGDREVDPVEHDVLAEGLAHCTGTDCRRIRIVHHGLLAFSDPAGCRGVHRRRAAPHGALSSPAPSPAVAPPVNSPTTSRIAESEKPVMNNPNASAISARAVRKSFGEHIVLNGVDLTVTEGTIFSLLGPNGAGKTTMVRILSTLIRADAGDIWVGGHDVASDPNAVRSLIGVTGQFSAVDNLLTGDENLRLMADLRHLGRDAGRRRIAELLERFELTDAANKPLSTYSGGMRRRLDLAMTLIGNPTVIFLDEPTTGLDPRSRRTMWQIIRELATDGVTILLTTQYLEEADQLADQVAVLDRGRIVAEGTPAELKRRMSGGHVQLHFAEPQSLRSAANMLPNATPDLDQLTLQVPGAGCVASLRHVLNELDGARIDVEHLSIHTPDLDDVFFAVTGHAPLEPAHQEEEALQR